MMEGLPEGWELKNLNDVTEIIMGQSPPSNTYNNENIGLPFFQGKAEFGKRHPKIKIFCSNPKKTATKNDILMSVRAPVGSINISNTDCCIGRGLCAIRCKDKLNFLYLYHYLKANEKSISLKGVGSTFTAISKKDVHNIEIPLPPLLVQKKIADMLEKTEKLKTWRVEADKLTDEFLKSTFMEMFGDPVKNPKGWDIKTIEDFSSEIVDCPHSTPKHVEYITDFPCIRTTELKGGYIDWKQMKYLDEEEYEKRVKRLVPVAGDVIYGREGSFGEAVRIPANTKISLGQRVMLFRPNSKVCNSEFFWALLNSDSIYFQALKKTNGSTVGHVNIKDIKKFKCIFPPLPLQQKFTAIVQQVEQMRQCQQESKAHIDDLFNALMQKAFKGELVA